MRDGKMRWEPSDERTWTMELTSGGVDWVEVRRLDAGAGPTWHVDARLDGSHYKVADAFSNSEAAQGCALLLAMRLLPALRVELRARLDEVPGAWWWEITPGDSPSADQGSVFASRVADSAASAERSGRAAGPGGHLCIHGPRSEGVLREPPG
jgi:hypothetical protein